VNRSFANRCCYRFVAASLVTVGLFLLVLFFSPTPLEGFGFVEARTSEEVLAAIGTRCDSDDRYNVTLLDRHGQGIRYKRSFACIGSGLTTSSRVVHMGSE
jgi:hypothetical protein